MRWPSQNAERMKTTISADRAGKARAQQYTFPTVQLRYVYEVDPTELPTIRNSSDAVKQVIWHMFEPFVCHHEEFHVILMNSQNRIVGYYPMSMGGLSNTAVDVRMILQAAILANCSAIIVVHNHPTGALSPSEADRKVTKKIQQACEVMDIRLLDHLIVTPNKSYFSFDEHGLL